MMMFLSAVDNFFDQWDLSTVSPIEEVRELQKNKLHLV